MQPGMDIVENTTPPSSTTSLLPRKYGKPMALSSLLVYSSCYDLDHTVSCRVTFQTPICTCAGSPAQGDVRGEWAMATVLPKLVGDRIKRREDPALIQGLGRYVDDIPMVGTLHAAFFRSPYAHARIKSLNVEAAKNLPEVGTVPCGAAGPGMKVPVNHALAVDKIGFVGQPIAVVVANNPYVAQDAVNLIEMEVDVLPAVVDP